MSSKNTYIAKARKTMIDRRTKVMQLLEMDDLEHNDLLLELGCLFAENYIGNEKDRRIVKTDPNYWRWFRDEYSAGQQAFLGLYKTYKYITLWEAQILYNLYMKSRFLEKDFILQSFENYLKLLYSPRFKIES